MTDSSQISEEIDSDQKNANKVRCQHCDSLILSKGSATYIEKEVTFGTEAYQTF